jgi:hypothetical protein
LKIIELVVLVALVHFLKFVVWLLRRLYWVCTFAVKSTRLCTFGVIAAELCSSGFVFTKMYK